MTALKNPHFLLIILLSLTIKSTTIEKEMLENEARAEEFLTSLESKDNDPRVLFKKLAEKFNIKKTSKIHRKDFQKFLVEFELKENFENCKRLQFSFNSDITHFIKNKKEKNIAIIMNEFDNFMALIKDGYVSYEFLEKICLEKYFHKFMYNLSHKQLRDRKHFIARETLSELGEKAFEQPFDIDL